MEDKRARDFFVPHFFVGRPMAYGQGSLAGARQNAVPPNPEDPLKEFDTKISAEFPTTMQLKLKSSSTGLTSKTIALNTILVVLGAIAEDLLNKNSVSPEEEKVKLAWQSLVDYRRMLEHQKGVGVRSRVHHANALIWPFALIFDLFKRTDPHTIPEYEKDENLLKKSWNVLCNISLLANHPTIMALFAKRVSKPIFAGKPLLFIFTLRNLLVKLAFYTQMNLAVIKTLQEQFRESNYKWINDSSAKDAYVFVGFNRLMSPQNTVGVSLSSDIDYKLVFNPSVIQKQPRGKLDKRDMKNIVDALQAAQKGLVDQFQDEAGMVLEVMGFTTKDLKQLGVELVKFDAERNFLASIYYNNAYITGSEKVFEEFKLILKTYKDRNNFIIAERTWIQYLGETDKGSITVIKNLEKLRDVIDACAPTLTNLLNQNRRVTVPADNGTRQIVPFQNWFVGTTGFTWDSNDTTQSTRLWVQSPVLFYIILSFKVDTSNDRSEKFEGMKENLVRVKAVRTALDNAPIFKVKSVISFTGRLISKNIMLERVSQAFKLGQVAKVLKELVDKDYLRSHKTGKLIRVALTPGFGRACLQQIGSTLVTHETPRWRFSLKYVCCRLNDFFDSVPNFADYQLWCKTSNKNELTEKEEATAKLVYDLAKELALVVNIFALSMQNSIYQLAFKRKDFRDDKEDYTVKRIPATHLQIDSLYARLTNTQYEEMVNRGPLRDILDEAYDKFAEIKTGASLSSSDPLPRSEFVDGVDVDSLITSLVEALQKIIKSKDFDELLLSDRSDTRLVKSFKAKARMVKGKITSLRQAAPRAAIAKLMESAANLNEAEVHELDPYSIVFMTMREFWEELFHFAEMVGKMIHPRIN